jgi:predicted transcriptional regulator
MDEKLMEKILEVYRDTGSLLRTAEEMGFAYAKIRKVLITLGVYSTQFSREVLLLRDKGCSVVDIASELGTTVKRVSAWLPYEKNMYSLPEKSQEAKRCDNYRKRIYTARKNSVMNKFTKNKKENKTMSKNELGDNTVNKGDAVRTPGDPIRLHLKLYDDCINEDDQQILKEFGRSSTGTSVERDILIPHDITLHSLHYAIQRLYGWQNSHLHSFRLPKKSFARLTNNMVRGWGALVGVLFQTVYPDDVWHERYGDDDYESGSFKTWLRKKYTGPYNYLGYYEQYDVAVREFDDFVEYFKNMAEYEPFHLSSDKKSKEEMIIKYSAVTDLTLDELKWSLSMDSSEDELLERLVVSSILAPVKAKTVASDKLNQKVISRYYRDYGMVKEPEVKPVTNKLIYDYDYGDSWSVEITRLRNCDDLLEKGFLSNDELIEAQNVVIEKYKPVCIHQDGMFLLDDVGGLGGFIHLLRILNSPDDPYETDETETKDYMQKWAQSMGWSTRKVANKQML